MLYGVMPIQAESEVSIWQKIIWPYGVIALAVIAVVVGVTVCIKKRGKRNK
jgi:hypothetical protein